MDIVNITAALHSKINVATDLQELLMLSKALERLNTGQVRTVATYTDLFGITPNNDGELFFVDDEDRLYFLVLYGDAVATFPITETGVTAAYAWGSNANGRLGDNTIADRSSPVSVVGGFSDWIAVGASSGGLTTGHSLGVRANGSLWAWGINTNGRLGDDTITDRSSPVSVVGGFSDWIAASAGNRHNLGVRANGSLWAWGNNGSGVLGDDTITDRSSPVSVVGGFSDWVSASAGGYHSLGVRTNGSLWAWGDNGQGRLGDNTVTSRRSPVSVVGGFSDWISASAGRTHSLGVRANGSIWAWGDNGSGRLGDNTITNRSSPVSVVGSFSDWISASAGGYHSLGVRANGSLWSWGAGSNGRLGNNGVTNQSSPVSVVGGFSDWVSASAGNFHSLGVRANGSLWAWGDNGSGRLGDNTTTSRSSPVSVVGSFSDWISASAGRNHSLGILVQKTSAVQ
jgi:alpha-tubulin suppressor-like RCC1 family protein